MLTQNSLQDSKQMLVISSQKGSDYEILERPTQIIVKQKTFKIKGSIRQTAQEIIEIGQKLAEVKQQLKHGQFSSWLKSEFNWLKTRCISKWARSREARQRSRSF